MSGACILRESLTDSTQSGRDEDRHGQQSQHKWAGGAELNDQTTGRDRDHKQNQINPTKKQSLHCRVPFLPSQALFRSGLLSTLYCSTVSRSAPSQPPPSALLANLSLSSVISVGSSSSVVALGRCSSVPPFYSWLLASGFLLPHFPLYCLLSPALPPRASAAAFGGSSASELRRRESALPFPAREFRCTESPGPSRHR